MKSYHKFLFISLLTLFLSGCENNSVFEEPNQISISRHPLNTRAGNVSSTNPSLISDWEKSFRN